MAALHHALQTLSPTSFSEVPLDEPGLSTYLQEAFARCQALVDSVPPPPVDASITSARSRANTGASTASNVSEVSSSSARPEAPIPEHAILQKEWGKPVKLSAKENPLGMGVYKLSSKDGRGAWFARRSVHEGLPFSQWKDGLQGEFPESLKVQGGPGEGNIRGIGGERRVERKETGVGTMEVYHLSAQFPGPTTPRDFVTLLLTSSSAITVPSTASTSTMPNLRGNLPAFTQYPRHFMVISKPCKHPDCPPRDGFIRGEYESIEFIREIPKTPRKSSSTTDLPRPRRLSDTPPSIDKEAILRHARQQSADYVAAEGRTRGKTISFAESRGSVANGESIDRHEEPEDDLHPVEWIMITRSDPGGSVPRFMVERGTPSGIVSDAGKFIDWACKRGARSEAHDAKESIDEGTGLQATEPSATNGAAVEETNMNSHLTGLDGVADHPKSSLQPTVPSQTPSSAQGNGIFSSLVSTAYSGLEAYAPQVVIDRLPAHASASSLTINPKAQSDDPFTSDPFTPTKEQSTLSPISSTTSIATFASADSHLASPPSSPKSTNGAASTTTTSPVATSHERELAKLATRKQQLDAKLLKVREKETKNKEELTSKEKERLRKAEEKHAREIHKVEEKHEKEVKSLEAKRKREEIKSEEKMKRTLDKDDKARLVREKEELRQELELIKREKDIYFEQVGKLQRENTVLVARLGKLEDGGKILRDVKDDLTSGVRSRSSSLRRMKERGEGSTIGVGEALSGQVGAAILQSRPGSVKSEH